MTKKLFQPLFFFLFSILILRAPLLYSSLFVHEEPATSIQGSKSFLNRPEGVSFSPSGDCIVIASSSGNSLSFYKRIGDSGGKYETIPTCSIKNSKILNYVHDVSFSPCGQYVVAACRENNTLVCFQRREVEEFSFNRKPFWCISGFQKAKLQKPTSIAISPCGRIIAVANRESNYSTNFYTLLPKNDFRFDPIPFYTITADELAENNVSASHGVAFSPDGSTLATVHKRWQSNPPGESALTFFEKEKRDDGQDSFFLSNAMLFDCACLHSIAFHPSGRYLAATHEKEDVLLFEKEEGTNAFVPMTSIAIDKKGEIEGPKGIAFSPCGQYLAVTTVANLVLIYEVEESTKDVKTEKV